MKNTPRLLLRRTRRGWIVAALAAVATAGGLAGDLASAEGTPATCSADATTTTVATVDTTTDDSGTCTDPTTTGDDSTTTTTTTTTVAQDPPPPVVPPTPPAAPDPGPAVAPPAPPSTPADPTVPSSTPDTPAPPKAHHPHTPPADHPQGKPDAAGGHHRQGAVVVSAPSPKAGARAQHHHNDKHARHHQARGQVTVGRVPAVGTAPAAGTAPSDQQYFPSVSVDWGKLTPLAPEPFPGSAAQSFPGPQFLLPIYEAAAVQYDVPWQVLAAINEVETGWGHNQGPSSAGAIGWMQFMPATWKVYGVDANGDGYADPGDPVDAIFSAARYLHEAGAEHDLGRSIFAYNHSNQYVDMVVQRAIELGSIPDDLLTALTNQGRNDADAILRATGSKGLLDPKARVNSVGRAMLLGDKRLEQRILDDPNITIYPCGRSDIAAGIVDRRVLVVLQYLAAHYLKPTVSALRCGHGYYTTSGNVSEHSSGDAVDISEINGIPILGHQGPGSITERTIKELLKLGGGMRPHQIISLMTFAGADNTLALGDHANHIHVGFRPARKITGF